MKVCKNRFAVFPLAQIPLAQIPLAQIPPPRCKQLDLQALFPRVSDAEKLPLLDVNRALLVEPDFVRAHSNVACCIDDPH